MERVIVVCYSTPFSLHYTTIVKEDKYGRIKEYKKFDAFLDYNGSCVKGSNILLYHNSGKIIYDPIFEITKEIVIKDILIPDLDLDDYSVMIEDDYITARGKEHEIFVHSQYSLSPKLYHHGKNSFFILTLRNVSLCTINKEEKKHSIKTLIEKDIAHHNRFKDVIYIRSLDGTASLYKINNEGLDLITSIKLDEKMKIEDYNEGKLVVMEENGLRPAQDKPREVFIMNLNGDLLFKKILPGIHHEESLLHIKVVGEYLYYTRNYQLFRLRLDSEKAELIFENRGDSFLGNFIRFVLTIDIPPPSLFTLKNKARKSFLDVKIVH